MVMREGLELREPARHIPPMHICPYPCEGLELRDDAKRKTSSVCLSQGSEPRWTYMQGGVYAMQALLTTGPRRVPSPDKGGKLGAGRTTGRGRG